MITVSGTLYKVLEERAVGKKGWKVRDFVIQFESSRGTQFRLLQAGGTLLRELVSIPHGSKISCEVTILGKECMNTATGIIKYRNLDEVTKIHYL